MRTRNFIIAGLVLASVACGDDDPKVQDGDNNTTANNTTANNTTANNVSPNNTTANNVSPNNTTPNNVNPGNNGSPLACAGDFGAADACGGDPVGVWDVSEACTNFDYEGLIQGACASATVSDAVLDVTGTLAVTAANFAQDVSGTIAVTMNTPDGCGLGNCALVQGALEFAGATATCTDAGGGCDCSASFEFAQTSAGSYTTANGVATLGSGQTYYYCASGGTMLLRQFGTNADDRQPTTLYTQ